MSKEKLFKQQRFIDKQWQDVKGIDPKGESILKVARITDEQAKSISTDQKTIGLRWVECSKDEIQEVKKRSYKNIDDSDKSDTFDYKSANVAQLDEFIKKNEIEVEEGANKATKQKAIDAFLNKD